MIEAYLGDCEVRGLATGTLRNYRNTLEDLAEFCRTHGAPTQDRRFIEVLTEFRASRKGRNENEAMKPTTHRKELEALRTFCAWCLDRDRMPRNWAKALRPPNLLAAVG